MILCYGLISSLLLLVVQAAVFHIPLNVDNSAFASTLSRGNFDGPFNKRFVSFVSEQPSTKRALQKPFNAPNLFNRFHRVEIWDSVFPEIFATAAALGNPPQPFRLNIDLAWDTLFVPSVDCIGKLCNKFGDTFQFQSSLSSTFQPGSSPWAHTSYAGANFGGPIAHDSLHIAGLEIKDQAFINAEMASSQGWISFYVNYDGVLGLAPRWNASLAKTPTPSPWTSMVNQSLLDRNLFAIDLPHAPYDYRAPPRLGEISFGGINPKYGSSDFTSLPLSNYTDQAWTIEAQSLTWTNRTHPIHATFSTFTLAGFDSASWYIGLPGTLANEINAQVRPTCGVLFCAVVCARRHEMPDLVFGIWGREVRVSALEYALEVEQGMCLFNVVPVPRGAFPVDAIVLGTPVLNAFYSVFDLGGKEVRLAKSVG